MEKISWTKWEPCLTLTCININMLLIIIHFFHPSFKVFFFSVCCLYFLVESSHFHWISLHFKNPKSSNIYCMLMSFCLEVFITAIVLLKCFMQKQPFHYFHQKEACINLHLRRENVNNCLRTVYEL